MFEPDPSGSPPLPSPVRPPRIDRALHPPRFFSWRMVAIVAGVLLLLGTIAGFWYQARTAPRRAAAIVIAAGGKVRYAHDNPATQTIVAVELTGPEVRDELLAALAPWSYHLPDVRSLDLRHAAITDNGLAALAGADIQTLRLDGTAVTDAGLSYLADLPNLESLSLQNTAVSDAGLKALVPLPRLQMLYLSGSQVSPAGLRNLADCHALQYVQVEARQADPAAIEQLKSQRPGLIVSTPP